MGKIGRNHPCPCGSGKKFKHCHINEQHLLQPDGDGGSMKLTLMDEIGKVQLAAVEKRAIIRELGVFIFFSTTEGDAWLLEVTDTDAIQLASKGEKLAVPIDENPEIIEVDWSHIFEFRGKELYRISYENKAEALFENAPTHQIKKAVQRIRKRYTPELLEQVHVRAD